MYTAHSGLRVEVNCVKFFKCLLMCAKYVKYILTVLSIMYDLLQYFKKGFYYFNIKLWNTLIISLNLYDFLGHFQPIVAHGHNKLIR